MSLALVFSSAGAQKSGRAAETKKTTGKSANSQSAPVFDAPNISGILGIVGVASAKASAGVSARVLVIAAHPDDEDTRLISWLARGHKANVAYLSLTRGDGGQNLIGNELGEKLGVVRSQELLAARRIDGAHQYFSRAFDFGFSKTSEETFRQWSKDSILGDVVQVIRAFKPDIIVSIFSGTDRDGHGHHQAAGILSREAFDAAADTRLFPVEKFGQPWQTQKFYRAAWFRRETATLSMNVGEYSEIYGRSYAEIAAISRSQHKSQGFGAAQDKGEILDYVKREISLVNGEMDPKSETSIFDGLAKSVNDSVAVVNDSSASNSPPITNDSSSIAIKVADANLALEVFADKEFVALGDSIKVRYNLYRRGVLDVSASGTAYYKGEALTQPYWLSQPRTGSRFQLASWGVSDDEREKKSWFYLPVKLDGVSQEIVLRAPVQYRVIDPVAGDVRKTVAVVPPISVNVATPAELVRAGAEFTRVIEVSVRSFVDGVDPAGSVNSVNSIDALLRGKDGEGSDNGDATGGKDSRASQTRTRAKVSLVLPPGIKSDSISKSITFIDGRTIRVAFQISGVLPEGSFTVGVVVNDGVRDYTQGFTEIVYDHIPTQRVYSDAVVNISSVSVSVPEGLKIGYVQGVGDNVFSSLAQLGLNVEQISPASLHSADLSGFSTIVIGPRAYQIHPELVTYNKKLLQYAQSGGNLVVQYGQYEMASGGLMPYPITLTRPADRVTEEVSPVVMFGLNGVETRSADGSDSQRDSGPGVNSAVHVDSASASLLAIPNKISITDFDGWVQERSLYMPTTIDKRYSVVLGMNDSGERLNANSIITTKLGSGRYTYTTIAFFRQIPAGVPGAVRLFVNLLSYKR